MKDKTLINEKIKANRILLISENGERLGEFLRKDAIAIALDKGLDLVQMSDSIIPVCKIMDYGKFSYDQKKKNKKSRTNSSSSKTKELRLKISTEENDVKTIIRKAEKFLLSGNKVKITVQFRGREAAHKNLVIDKCYNIFERLKNNSEIESRPVIAGRQASMIISPI